MTLRMDIDPSLTALVNEALDILMEAKRQYSPVKTFVLISGGNDSTTLAYLVRADVDAAVHIRTGIGIPQTTAFVRQTCEVLGLPLIELTTPPEVYRDIVLGPSRKGFPGPGFHYITYHRLKSQRLQELQRDHTKRGQRLLLVSGVRSQESERRMLSVGSREHEPPRGRLNKCAWANPIVHWTSHDMNRFREAFAVPRSEVAISYTAQGSACVGPLPALGS